MFDYNIWLTLFLPTEVFWPWPRERNCPSKFSTMDDFYFEGGHPSRHMESHMPTWPSHGVSTPIWLSVNCYCFAPHYKSLSLLSFVSVSTLFFPKIISRCICRMLLYMSKLTQQAPERFWKPNKNRPQGKRTRAFVCVHPPLTRLLYIMLLFPH